MARRVFYLEISFGPGWKYRKLRQILHTHTNIKIRQNFVLNLLVLYTPIVKVIIYIYFSKNSFLKVIPQLLHCVMPRLLFHLIQ
jgi:hypothetical protein